VVPIPRSERDSLKAGGFSIGVETRHEEKLPPVMSALMILVGASNSRVSRDGVTLAIEWRNDSDLR
jgi:hypothetical protein